MVRPSMLCETASPNTCVSAQVNSASLRKDATFFATPGNTGDSKMVSWRNRISAVVHTSCSSAVFSASLASIHGLFSSTYWLVMSAISMISRSALPNSRFSKVLGDAVLALDDDAVDVLRQRAVDPGLRAFGQAWRQLAVEALGDKAGAAAGDIDVFADQIAIHAGDEIFAVEVQVFHFRIQFERDVVAQPFRIHAQVQVAQRRDAGAARLRHFFVVDRQEAVHIDFQFVDHRVIGKFQHGGPEQQVEGDDVLADKVDLFGARVVQEGVEIDALLVAIVFQAGQVADRRVHPHIEELARRIRNRDAEVGRVARDIPVGQFFTGFAQPFADLVDHFRLQAAGRVQPILEEFKAARVRQFEEILFRRLHHRRGVGKDRERVDQVGRLVGRAAHFAIVAVLVLGAAFRAFALDIAVGQEHAFYRIEEAVDGLGDDQARIAQFAVHRLATARRFPASRSNTSYRKRYESRPGTGRGRRRYWRRTAAA